MVNIKVVSGKYTKPSSAHNQAKCIFWEVGANWGLGARPPLASTQVVLSLIWHIALVPLNVSPISFFLLPAVGLFDTFFALFIRAQSGEKWWPRTRHKTTIICPLCVFLFSADLINLLHVNCPGSVCDDISFSLAWLRFQHHLSLSGWQCTLYNRLEDLYASLLIIFALFVFKSKYMVRWY